MDNNISNEQLVSYLENVMQQDTYKKVIATLNVSDGERFFEKFLNIISKYYISTFDDDINHAMQICCELYSYNGNDFFTDVLMDKIYAICSTQVNLTDNYLENNYNICDLIQKRNKMNNFYTHCFPGAILDDVKENGLDATRFKFKEEVEILSEFFNTPFKIGDLYYCELSEASVGYATLNVPESIMYYLGGINNKNDDETIYEMTIRSFKENLEKCKQKGASEEKIQQLYNAGMKIIDYYCKTPKAGIAIIRGKSSETEYKFGSAILSTEQELGYNNSVQKILNELKKYTNSSPSEMFSAYNNLINQVCIDNPELKVIIEEVLRHNFSKELQNRLITNYSYGGNADGYEIPGRKLSPDKFTILQVDVPRELHISLNRENYPKINKSDVNIHDNHEKEIKNFCSEAKLIEKIPSDSSNIQEIFYLETNGFKQMFYVDDTGLKPAGLFSYQIGNDVYISSLNKQKLSSEYINQNIDFLIANNSVSDEMINAYKKSDLYDESFDIGDELIYSAAHYYCKSLFESLDDNEKNRILIELSKKYDGYVVSYNESGYYINRDGVNQPLNRSNLMSTYENAPYNGLYSSIIDKKGNSR